LLQGKQRRTIDAHAGIPTDQEQLGCRYGAAQVTCIQLNAERRTDFGHVSDAGNCEHRIFADVGLRRHINDDRPRRYPLARHPDRLMQCILRQHEFIRAFANVSERPTGHVAITTSPRKSRAPEARRWDAKYHDAGLVHRVAEAGREPRSEKATTYVEGCKQHAHGRQVGEGRGARVGPRPRVCTSRSGAGCH